MGLSTIWPAKSCFFWQGILPICSMYGIFTSICPNNHPNVGKYTIHRASGLDWHCLGKHNSNANDTSRWINLQLYDRGGANLVRKDWSLFCHVLAIKWWKMSHQQYPTGPKTTRVDQHDQLLSVKMTTDEVGENTVPLISNFIWNCHVEYSLSLSIYLSIYYIYYIYIHIPIKTYSDPKRNKNSWESTCCHTFARPSRTGEDRGDLELINQQT